MPTALLTTFAVAIALSAVGGPSRRAPAPVGLQRAVDTSTRSADTARPDTCVACGAACSSRRLVGDPPGCGGARDNRCGPRARGSPRCVAPTRRAIDAALPDAIEMLVLVIQTGMTPHQAIDVLTERAPSPVRPAFADVRHRIARGAPLADAIDALPDRLGLGATPSPTRCRWPNATARRSPRPWSNWRSTCRERRRRRAEADARKLPIRMSFPLVALHPAVVRADRDRPRRARRHGVARRLRLLSPDRPTRSSLDDTVLTIPATTREIS